MREIIFRGKRVDNGEWVEGYITEHTMIPHDMQSYIGFVIECKPKNLYEYDWYEVIHKTVGQYTGLKDKNGKRIFEGDILRHHNDCPDSESKEIGSVFWDEKYCGWRRTSNGEFHHGVVDTYRLSPSCVYEIIGNIHDNPELLED